MASSDEPERQPAAIGLDHARFSIQKIYLKDVSFESPNAPEVFRTEWRPDLDLQMASDASQAGGDLYEVTIRVTSTVKLAGEAAYVAEVTQAGLFEISGFGEEDLRLLLASTCPTMLFPYLREAVSDLVARGGFPQLLLSPVDFETLYRRQLQAQPAPSVLDA